ncbi:MAG: hypothetical protein HRT45_12990 [Bdellovibrionales bacterium]|nr:hypothetical protein [Bdellovibrionales bacterium]
MIYAIGLLVLSLSWMLPWWGFAAICFLLGHKMKSAFGAFAKAFVAVFCVWGIVAYIENIQSQGFMAIKMSSMFSIPHPMLMILLTALVGGLLGGVWCASGFYLHQLLLMRKQKRA